MVKEALGDLYTEHVKITVKKSKSDSAFVFNNEHNSDMKTFKQTYFGATNKSQSFDHRLILDNDENKSDDNEDTILPEDEGRHQFFIFKNYVIIIHDFNRQLKNLGTTHILILTLLENQIFFSDVKLFNFTKICHFKNMSSLNSFVL